MNPIKAILDLLYPRICFVCGERLNSDETILCSECLHKLPRTWEAKCRQNLVEQAFCTQPHFVRGAAYCFYRKNSDFSHLIHRMKYNEHQNGFPEIGSWLGEMAARELESVYPGIYKGIDLIIPVPLHEKKLQKRGYNQAVFIANGLSKVLQIPVESGHIIKIFNNDSQTTKNNEERQDNTNNAYQIVAPESLRGKHILLVDDIITTGATMRACMECLDAVSGIRYSVFALGIAK